MDPPLPPITIDQIQHGELSTLLEEDDYNLASMVNIKLYILIIMIITSLPNLLYPLSILLTQKKNFLFNLLCTSFFMQVITHLPFIFYITCLCTLHQVHSTPPITKKKYVEILLCYRWLFVKDDVFIGERHIFGAEVFLHYRQFFVTSDFVIGRVECSLLECLLHNMNNPNLINVTFLFSGTLLMKREPKSFMLGC